MVVLYADLVSLGLRTLDPEPGKIAVPTFLRNDVEAELERRTSAV
jgi:hypothetical protein